MLFTFKNGNNNNVPDMMAAKFIWDSAYGGVAYHKNSVNRVTIREAQWYFNHYSFSVSIDGVFWENTSKSNFASLGSIKRSSHTIWTFDFSHTDLLRRRWTLGQTGLHYTALSKAKHQARSFEARRKIRSASGIQGQAKLKQTVPFRNGFWALESVFIKLFFFLISYLLSSVCEML